MFELVRIYETANNETNKFLRAIYLKYIRASLKRIYFKKFNLNMELDKTFLTEFMTLYTCSGHKVIFPGEIPIVHTVDTIRKVMFIKYYDFQIILNLSNDEYKVELVCTNLDREVINRTVQLFPTEENLNSLCLREIIILGIYNYNVSYIYGKKSKLYNYNDKFIDEIYSTYF